MDGDTARFLAILIPLCTIASAALVAAIRTRPANTQADEDAADGQWRRTIDWNLRLAADLEACQHKLAVAEADALKWKAIAEGIGQNRQEEATLLAAERLAERKQGK